VSGLPRGLRCPHAADEPLDPPQPGHSCLGRAFANFASQTLGLPSYDTPCGAKLFRAGSETDALFAEPFLTRGLFDLELVARRIAARVGRTRALDDVLELPLEVWHDVGASKERPADFVRAGVDLLRIRQRDLRGTRR